MINASWNASSAAPHSPVNSRVSVVFMVFGVTSVKHHIIMLTRITTAVIVDTVKSTFSRCRLVVLRLHYYNITAKDKKNSTDRNPPSQRCMQSTMLIYISYGFVHGSFFQHGNNSGKRDTVAFHGACNECSTNVDDLRISNTTLTCLAFQTCMTLCV